MERNKKKFYQSMGVNGGLLTIVTVLGPMIGVHLTGSDLSDGAQALTSVVGGIGGLLAVIGRVRATSRIG